MEVLTIGVVGLLGLLVGIGAVVALFFAPRAALVAGIVAILFAVGTASLGLALMWFAQHQAEQVADEPSLSAAEKAQIARQRRADAPYALIFGGVAAFPPLVLGAIGAIGGTLKRRRSAH